MNAGEWDDHRDSKNVYINLYDVFMDEYGDRGQFTHSEKQMAVEYFSRIVTLQPIFEQQAAAVAVATAYELIMNFRAHLAIRHP